MPTTNIALLEKKIQDSGIKRKVIAQKADLTYQGLLKKTKGVREFTASEIQSLAKTLNLSTDEIFAIFFTGLVDKTATSKQKGA